MITELQTKNAKVHPNKQRKIYTQCAKVHPNKQRKIYTQCAKVHQNKRKQKYKLKALKCTEINDIQNYKVPKCI